MPQVTPNEAKTRKELIDPALEAAGWNVADGDQVGIEIPVDGFNADSWKRLQSQLNSLQAQGIAYDGEIPKGISDIEDAIQDTNLYPAFDRLVVAVDSEEMTKEEKYTEIRGFVSCKPCLAEIRIIVQHFCFETWGLGNRKVIRTNPNSQRLREYKKIFDVRLKDPELLPPKPDEGLNRAQFAEKYLRVALNDKYRNLTYTKSNPRPLAHAKYFAQLKKRVEDTNHIAGFADLLDAFL